MTTQQPTYRAFISYSWHDRDHADAVYSRLSNFKVPRVLTGRETMAGTVPRRLGKIFMDRESAKAGAVNKIIQEALSASEYLIVICSPHSCKSKFVNDEISYFKRLGRSDKILPLIVDGRSDCPETNCFPGALKLKVDADGVVIDEEDEEILAPNVRDSSGGLDVALIRLVAGMLGLEPLDLMQRRAIEERRGKLRARLVAATMALLFLVSAGLAGLAYTQTKIAQKNQEEAARIAARFADRVGELTNNLQIPSAKEEKLLADTLKSLEEIAPRSSGELKSYVEATKDYYDARIQRLSKPPRDWVPLAERSADTYRTLILDRKNNPNFDFQRGLAKAAMLLGGRYNDQCMPSLAEEAYMEAEKARELVSFYQPDIQSNETHRQYQLDHSTALMDRGKVLRQQGRLREAHSALTKAEKLRQQIVAVFDGTSGAEADRALLDRTEVTVELADLARFSGDHKAQLERLHEVVAIRDELIKRHPSDANFKRLLAWGQIYLAEAKVESGEAVSVIAPLREALNKQEGVLAFDPDNPQREKDRAWAEGHLADALAATGNYQEADSKYAGAIGMLEGALSKTVLQKLDRAVDNRKVAYWLMKRGKARRLNGNTTLARMDLTRAAELMPRAADLDITNLQHKAELGLIYLELSQLERQAQNLQEALRLGGLAVDTLKAVSKEAPTARKWEDWAIDAEIAYQQLPSAIPGLVPVTAPPVTAPVAAAVPQSAETVAASPPPEPVYDLRPAPR